jgi:hypothetical protein
MVIHQPRLHAVTEDVLTVAELEQHRVEVRRKADLALSLQGVNPLTIDRSAYNPDKKACWYCPARDTCPALAHDVLSAIGGVTPSAVEQSVKGLHEIPDDDLPDYFKLLPLMRRWADAIEERAYKVLADGGRLSGYKLVHGRKPHRRWSDADAVVQTMRDMRVRSEDMYTQQLISPSKAEILLRDSPKQWARLRDYVVQGSGRVEIAPIDDPRPVAGEDQDFLDLKDL